MRKVLEYSEFVSGESIKDKLMALEIKWVDFSDEVYAIYAINQTERMERILGKYGELARQIGRMIPLDSEDTEEIAEDLEVSVTSSDIGHLVYYLVKHHLSRLNSHPNYVEITPIKWTEVK